MTDWHVSFADIVGRIDASNDGPRFDYPIRHGTMRVGVYAPRGTDPQSPHTQDEIYIVASGEGWFVRGDERWRFAPGDVLFVPAGDVHRFEDFTDDFATWVVFWGPEGGEAD